MRICLYAAIASHDENLRQERSRWAEVKRFIKRTRDRALWRLSEDKTFDHYSWCSEDGTNRGDMAIRLAIQDLFARHLASDIEYIEYTWGTLDRRAIDIINSTCDLFVIAGGGYLFSGREGALGNATVPTDLRSLPQISCPKIAYGIGLNQVLLDDRVPATRFNPSAAETMRSWIDAMDVISVRDAATRDILAPISERPIYLIGDPALFLEAPRSPRVAADHIAVNFAVHGPRAVAILRQHYRKYVRVLRELQKKNLVLRYVQHSDADPVLLEMLACEGLKLEVVDAGPRGMAQAYSEVELSFSQMLHSSILAASVDVPSISVAYDRKNFAFYELMGLQRYCLRHNQFSESWALDRVEEMRGERAALSESLARKKASLLQEHRALIERMAALVQVRPLATSGT